MVSKSEIRDAVAAIRAQRDLVALRNGLRPAVVESWLAEVEEKCGQEVHYEADVRVCLRVLERWVSPVAELGNIQAVLTRI
jgi:hypothetical protein